MKKKYKKWLIIGIIIFIILAFIKLNSNLSLVSEHITCTKDSNCYDANDNTRDVCINPGEIVSHCLWFQK